ncbi:hypothetical protein [Thermofilum sp.]|uniref:hypothetical protein n=1 Tax=Thermofilum sp. TaxID=1961369 RepID=UPI00258B5043|nr:hypothetical protein [Thermofilum sp.]
MSKDISQKISVSGEPGVSVPAPGESAIGVEKLSDLFYKLYTESKQAKLRLSIQCMPYETYVIQNGKPVKVVKSQWHVYVDIERGEKIQELKATVEIIDTDTWQTAIKEVRGFHWDVYRAIAETVAKYQPTIIEALLCRWENVWNKYEVNKE